MSWTIEERKDKPELHNGIKCMTCDKMLARKTECSRHKGHDVVYLDKKGEPLR